MPKMFGSDFPRHRDAPSAAGVALMRNSLTHEYHLRDRLRGMSFNKGERDYGSLTRRVYSSPHH